MSCATSDDRLCGLKINMGLATNCNNQKSENIASSCRLRAYTSIGTDNYNAPEVFLGNGYGPSVDVWSIGVVGYVLLFGVFPFQSTQSMLSAKTAPFPSHTRDKVSNLAKDLLAGLLTLDVDSRLTCDEALKHPWLSPYAS